MILASDHGYRFFWRREAKYIIVLTFWWKWTESSQKDGGVAATRREGFIWIGGWAEG